MARPVSLAPKQKRELPTAAEGRRVSVRLAERSRIVLLAAEGLQDKQTAALLGIDRITAAQWRNRYLEHGFDVLTKDAPCTGRPRSISADRMQQIVDHTTQAETAKTPQVR